MISTETKIRVRYADTDQMKTIYHSKYLEYFEQGRSDLLRETGMPYPKIEAMGFYLPVVEAHAKFLKSGKYDDLLVVKTILKAIPSVRVRLEYEIRNDDTGELLVEGYTIHGFVNANTGKPTRAPAQFLQVVENIFSNK
ncbi:MAG: thioesterase family protein [Bacteroidota bacterium]|nr:thioesterase family protein [Bacteroidota bacterium]